MKANIFEAASQLQIRFESKQGELNVEDLWTLSLKSLDIIGTAIHKKIKESEEFSLLDTKTSGDAILELKLEIIKHIIADKQAEAEEKRVRTEKSGQLETLKKLLADKKHDALKNLSEEEISAEILKLQS